MTEGRRRRGSVVVSPPLAREKLLGDNVSGAVVAKRRAKLQKVIDQLHDDQIKIKDWGNDPLHIEWILSPEVLARQDEFETLVKNQLGANWSVRRGTVELPGAVYSSQRIYGDTLSVRVDAGLAKTPLKRFLLKIAFLGPALIGLCYLAYIVFWRG
jgi:hypothetical protein